MPARRKWSTDDIGDAGEAIVTGWGRDARIGMAQHTPDRMGIDRWFEIPSEWTVPPGVGFDSVPANAQGYFQVKSSVRGKPTASVALGVWKRFIDCDVPCFFIGFELDGSSSTLTFVRAHVLHVDETVGSIALKKMRSLDANDAGAAGQTLSIPWQHASIVDGGADAADRFARILRDAIGDVAEYAARKRRWRDSVGYGDSPHRLKFAMALKREEYVAISLGDASVDANVLAATTVRFGIERPSTVGPSKGPAQFRFNARPLGDAVLRGTLGAQEFSIDGTILAGARLVHSHLSPLRFEAGALQVDLVPDLGRENRFESVVLRHRALATPQASFALDDCVRASRIIEQMCAEGAEARLVYDGKPAPLDITRPVEPPQGLFAHFMRLDWAALAADAVGLPKRHSINMESLDRQAFHLAIWGLFGSAHDERSLTLGGVTHVGPIVMIVPSFVNFGRCGIVLRVFAFRDDSPKSLKDGRITTVPMPIAATDPELVGLDFRAKNVDVVGLVDALVRQVDGDGVGIVRPRDDIARATWKRTVNAANKAARQE